MNPENRRELLVASLDLLELLADPKDPELDHVRAVRDWQPSGDDDDLVVEMGIKLLRRAHGELTTMARYLQVAVAIDSDVMGAYQSVQASAATEARSRRSERQQARAHELRIEAQPNARPLSYEQIAVRMTAERDAADEAAGRPKNPVPIRARTIERWLRPKKTPTGRRAVGPDDEQPG